MLLLFQYAPYKQGSKRTLANKAKDLGLEEPALNLLNGNVVVANLSQYIQPDNKDLSDLQAVEKGISHIIASVISTDSDLLSLLRNLRNESNCIVKTKKSSAKTTTKNVDSDESKFQLYFDFEIGIKFIKPHQVSFLGVFFPDNKLCW